MDYTDCLLSPYSGVSEKDQMHAEKRFKPDLICFMSIHLSIIQPSSDDDDDDDDDGGGGGVDDDDDDGSGRLNAGICRVLLERGSREEDKIAICVLRLTICRHY